MTAPASILQTVQGWIADPHSATKDEIVNLLIQLGYQTYPATDFREITLFYPPAEKTAEWRRFQLVTENPNVPISRIVSIAREIERYVERPDEHR